MKVLLIIPPFTQLNTPYPSVLQLAGFLQAQGYQAVSADLSLMVFRRLFSTQGLTDVFGAARQKQLSPKALTVYVQSASYIRAVTPVVEFLSGNNPMLAHAIVAGTLLPNSVYGAERQLNPDEAFGYFSLQDRAKFYASLFIDDLTLFIREAVTPHFGLSRYAEKLAAGIPEFGPLREELSKPPNYIDALIQSCTAELLSAHCPDALGYTVPFPGNLLGALRSAQAAKTLAPGCPVILGGGYVNTELRSLSDPGIFSFADYLTYDSGELPLLHILENLQGKNSGYVRTSRLQNGAVTVTDNALVKNIPHNALPAPSLNGIVPGQYVSVTELVNSMHRLWTDGFWHKLTIAHGCYWRQCTFCDVSLDYISRYSPAKAVTVVNWMEQLIAETGRSGFHFTDEAAPPALLRDIALEILRRGLSVTWWGNIRFEEAFTPGLCRLLALSGCVAVSGGLEVADDRLLQLIRKGVTLQQTARVCAAFRHSGIFVHAYLMYGFPTQTEQEVMNSLEMVRQFMELGLFQSAYWHRFALTVHSPIAANRAGYGVAVTSPDDNPFGNNDLSYTGARDADYSKFAEGLRVSLYNYMHGAGFGLPVSRWFTARVPKPAVRKGYIQQLLQQATPPPPLTARLLFVPAGVAVASVKGKEYVTVISSRAEARWKLQSDVAGWFLRLTRSASAASHHPPTLQQVIAEFPGGTTAWQKFKRTTAWREMAAEFLLFY